MLAEFFQNLMKRPPEAAPLPDLDAELAIGVLLVRLAKADAHYAVEEIARIDTLFARHRNLNPVEAAKMRATCEKLETQAPETAELAMMVRDNVSHSQRLATLGALWQISIADGVVRDEEQCFVTQVATQIGLTRDDVTSARPEAK